MERLVPQMNDEQVPERGTDADRWWRRGARQEARYQTQGMKKDAREVYEFVQVLAQQGRSADAVVRETAMVHAAGWSFRDRVRLAWKMVTNR